MSKSEYFRCPHCGAILNKTDSERVMGEARGGIMFGPNSRDCPKCGRTISRLSIVGGAYDYKRKSNPIRTIAWIAAVVTISLLMYQTDIPFLGSLAISLAVG